MNKSLKGALAVMALLHVSGNDARGASFNSASDFSPEFLMNSAFDMADDVGNEQINFSHIAGLKKLQETLASYVPGIRLLLREIEGNADKNDTIFSVERLAEINSWGKAERILINIGGADTNNSGDANIGYNVAFKFAKEHHNHHLDDVTIRFVPQVSQTQDGEFSIQGWYCETDIDWVNFTRDWKKPATADTSAAIGQSVQGGAFHGHERSSLSL